MILNLNLEEGSLKYFKSSAFFKLLGNILPEKFLIIANQENPEFQNSTGYVSWISPHLPYSMFNMKLECQIAQPIEAWTGTLTILLLLVLNLCLGYLDWISTI